MYRKLSKVIIDNFQIHEHKEVEFSDFSIITGPSNKGKTSILRAVKWCLYNTPPKSKNFITLGKSWCRVQCIFDDGVSIIREKGVGVNSYDVTLSDGSTFHMEDFGAGPINEVVRVHEMYEVDYFGEKRSLNMYSQLEPPFFLGESPTTKGVMLGKLARTDVIDLAIKNNASEIRQENAQLKKYKAELKDIKTEMSGLKGLPSLEKAIEYSDKRLSSMKEIQLKIDNISNLLSLLEGDKNKLEIIQRRLSSEEDINSVLECIESVELLNKKIKDIEAIYLLWFEENRKKQKLEKLISSVAIEEIEEQIKILDEVLLSSKRIEELITLRNKLIHCKGKKEELECKIDSEEYIDEGIELLDKALNIIGILNNILPSFNNLSSSMERKAKGDSVIRTLERNYDIAFNKYKASLIDAKKCPICMSDTTEDNLSNLEQML